MQVRYNDKRVAARKQVTGEAVERWLKMKGEMSDCIIHEVKRSVRYDIGRYGTRGGPGDNQGPIPELDFSSSRVVCRRRMDTGPQVCFRRTRPAVRTKRRKYSKNRTIATRQWSLWVQVFFDGPFNQIVTKL